MMTTPSAELDTLARALAGAHRTGRAISPADVPLPANQSEAVAVQSRVMGLLGEQVGGWKISMTPDGTAVPGIMYAGEMHSGTARHRLATGGAIGFEAEIAVRLATDLPARPERPYSRAEVENAVGAALAGIEIVDTRFGRAAKPSPLLALADRINNAGYVAGPDARDWRQLDLAKLRCVITKDGKPLFDKIGGHPQNDPLLPLVTYASAQIPAAPPLRAGQIVTLGSLIGLVWFETPCRLEVTIETLGTVSFDIVPR